MKHLLFFFGGAVLALACGDSQPLADAGGADAPATDAEAPVDAPGRDAADDPDTSCGCEEGATETRLTRRCGEETRSCSGCTWSEWERTAPDMEDPVCELGEAELADETCDDGRVRYRPCEACRGFAEAPSECGGGCPGERRTTPLDAEELCMPTRTFTRGCEYEDQDCFPRHDVTVSAFYIDRFQVTLRRYRECVVAGGCSPLEPVTRHLFLYNTEEVTDYTFADEELSDDGLVWSATHDQAAAFCRWDGARLPTGAEWERAALGNHDVARWPWRPERDLDFTYMSWCASFEPVDVCDGRANPNARLRDPWTFDAGVGIRPDAGGMENLFWFFEWNGDSLRPYGTPSEEPLLDPGEDVGPPYELRRAAGMFFLNTYRRDIAARDATTGPPGDHIRISGLFSMDGYFGAIRCARDLENDR